MQKKSVRPEDFPLKYTDPDKIARILEEARQFYPSFVHDWLSLIENNFATVAEADTLGYRRFFEDIYRFISWILISFYFQDEPPVEDSYRMINKIQQQFDRYEEPTFGVWQYTLQHLLTYFNRKSNRARFPIKELLFKSADILYADYGYERIFQDSLEEPRPFFNKNTRTFSPEKTSVLAAPVLLRNSIGHRSVNSSAIFHDIRPYNQDILCRLLEAFSFLNNNPHRRNRSFLYQSKKRLNDLFEFIVVDRITSEMVVMHGPAPLRRPVDLAVIPDDCDVFLRREDYYKKESFVPLYPLFEAGASASDSEFILSNVRFYGKVPFIRFSDRREREFREMKADAPAFRLLKTQFDHKQEYLESFGLNPQTLVERIEVISQDTLANSYLGVKYFPRIYIKRPYLEQHLNAFLADSRTTALIVSSEAGSGKSAWLSDVVYDQLAIRQSGGVPLSELTLPLFFNGGDFRLGERLDYAHFIAELVRNRLVFIDPNTHGKVDTSFENLFRLIDWLMRRSREQMPRQILLLIDAVNEAAASPELFRFLTGLIEYCTEKGKPRYPWLKIILSSRVLYFANTLDDRPRLSLNLYYNPHAGSITEAASLDELPTLRIPRFSDAETRQMFERLMETGEYPSLAQRKKWVSINRHNTLMIDTPLGLQLVAKVWEDQLKNQTVDESSFDTLRTDEVISIFYDYLMKDPTISSCLGQLSQRMIVKRSASVTPTEIRDIETNIQTNEHELGNLMYQSTVEKLLYQNVLFEKVETLLLEQDRRLVIRFVYQRFLEYVLFRYLERRFAPDWIGELKIALSQPSGDEFPEYEQALILTAYQVWTNERGDYFQLVELLAQDKPIDQHNRVVVGALFYEWAEAGTFPAEKVTAWKTKIEKLMEKLGERTSLSSFVAYFEQVGYETFFDRDGGRPLYDFCMDIVVLAYAREPLSISKFTFGLARTRRLLSLGITETFHRDLSRIELALERAIQEKEAQHTHLSNGRYGTPDYLTLKTLLANALLQRATHYRLQLFQPEPAIPVAEKALQVVDEVLYLQKPNTPDDERGRVSYLKYHVLTALGDCYYDYFAYSKAEEIYQEASAFLDGESLQAIVDGARIQHQLANIHQQQMDRQELLFRKEAMSRITVAYELMPTSISVKEAYARYAYELSRSLLYWGEIETPPPFTVKFAETVLGADPGNLLFRNLLGRAHLVQGNYCELVYENVPVALTCYRKALEIHYAILRDHPHDKETLLDASTTNLAIGNLYAELGQGREATTYLLAADEIIYRLSDVSAGKIQQTIGYLLRLRGENFVELRGFAVAKSMFEKSYYYLTRIKTGQESNVFIRHQLALVHTNLATLYLMQFAGLTGSRQFYYSPALDLPVSPVPNGDYHNLLLLAMQSARRAIKLKKQLLAELPHLEYIRESLLTDRLLNLLVYIYLNKATAMEQVNRILQLLQGLKTRLDDLTQPLAFSFYKDRRRINQSFLWIGELFALFSRPDESDACFLLALYFLQKDKHILLTYSPFYQHQFSLALQSAGANVALDGNYPAAVKYFREAMRYQKDLTQTYSRSLSYPRQLYENYLLLMRLYVTLDERAKAIEVAREGEDFFRQSKIAPSEKVVVMHTGLANWKDAITTLVFRPLYAIADWFMRMGRHRMAYKLFQARISIKRMK